jgi:hypothetical protein
VVARTSPTTSRRGASRVRARPNRATRPDGRSQRVPPRCATTRGHVCPAGRTSGQESGVRRSGKPKPRVARVSSPEMIADRRGVVKFDDITSIWTHRNAREAPFRRRPNGAPHRSGTSSAIVIPNAPTTSAVGQPARAVEQHAHVVGLADRGAWCAVLVRETRPSTPPRSPHPLESVETSSAAGEVLTTRLSEGARRRARLHRRTGQIRLPHVVHRLPASCPDFLAQPSHPAVSDDCPPCLPVAPARRVPNGSA